MLAPLLPSTPLFSRPFGGSEGGTIGGFSGTRRKAFNPTLFAAHDARARSAAALLFSTPTCPLTPLPCFLEVLDNPDEFGIDLLAYDFLTQKAEIEVEVRELWTPTQRRFPFNTVHILERKLKFFEEKPGVQTFFCAFRNDLGAVLVLDVHAKTHPSVHTCPRLRMRAARVGHDEVVVDVPLAWFQLVYLPTAVGAYVPHYAA